MSFEEFLGERLDALLRFAVVLCGERALAEDVVQEVLVRAHRQWPRIAAADAPFAYVRRMVVNEHLAFHRKWGRQIATADVAPTRTVPDHATQVTDRDDLMNRLAALPRRQRAAVVLRYYNGLTDQEIAAELGCSSGTVRSHLSRALASMRIQMTAESGTESSSAGLITARKDG